MEYQFPNNISPPDKQFDLFISHLNHYNELNTKPGPLIDINDISLLNNEISLGILSKALLRSIKQLYIILLNL